MENEKITAADAFEIGLESAAEYEGNLDEIDGDHAATEDLTQARLTPNLCPWYTALLAEYRAGRSDLYHAYAEGWDAWKDEVSA
jgi:vacuolar-type H+-ATPase subunit C/Vma6